MWLTRRCMKRHECVGRPVARCLSTTPVHPNQTPAKAPQAVHGLTRHAACSTVVWPRLVGLSGCSACPPASVLASQTSCAAAWPE